MRVAAIYDIHANLPALEAVLQDISQAGVDRVVVGGDVLPGPMPRETLTCLMDLNVPVRFIQGNGERAVLEQMAGMDSGTVPEQIREVVRWVAEELQPEQKRLIAIFMTLPRATLEEETCWRNTAITAITTYCKFEEGSP